MNFQKYQHIERMGKEDVEGILDGECFIFPKLDGTNASVWASFHELESLPPVSVMTIRTGSRNREITPEDDNAGFAKFVQENKEVFARLFEQHPNFRLYGEFLVKHTIKRYTADAWDKFYVFDVTIEHEGIESYLPFAVYQPILESFGIPVVPCMGTVRDYQGDFSEFVNNNTFLLSEGIGEGIIVKRYGFVNEFGRTQWMKVLAPEFKVAKATEEKPGLEDEIAEKYVTTTLVEKELAKLENLPSHNGIQGRLIQSVWHCILTEEMAEIVKKYKQPKIDFKLLQIAVTKQTKLCKPQLF